MLTIITTLLIVVVVVANARVRRTFEYQGIAVDSDGPVPDGDHTVTVSLYNASNGGTLLYREVHKVATFNGAFSLRIGAPNGGVPSPIGLKQMVWTGVAVDGGAEMVARTALGRTPQARQTASPGQRAANAASVVRAAHAQAPALSIAGGTVIS